MPIKTIQSFEEYHKQYAESINNPEKFWANIAESFTWQKKWDSVLNWNFEQPSVKWFEGAQLNITDNCLDRHLLTQPNKTAIIWEPNHPNESVRKLTYA